MSPPVILASSSETRRKILANVGLVFEAISPRVDERTIKESLTSEGVGPRDQADALAEAKARRVAMKSPESLVIGCDQVLEHGGKCLSKAVDPQDAARQLATLSGNSHHLHAACVIFEAGKPVWRHIGRATMTMHALSDAFIESYVQRNWQSIRFSVGSYLIEEEGPRLFSRIEGSHFAIQGLPLLELLSYLRLRGIATT